MLIKSIFFAAFYLASMTAFALTEFPAGKCKLEGLLYQAPSTEWYLVVNYGNNSETRFRLVGYKPSDKEAQLRVVEAPVSLEKKVLSLYGDAVVDGALKELNPYGPIKEYISSTAVTKACKKAN